MQLVEGQRLLQLSGIDQMLRIQFDDILIVGIADRKRRDQVVELKEVVPVKTDVERQLPENADLFRQGEFVNFEKPFRHGQISMRIVALVVEFGERSQRRDIHGVDLQRPVILGYGQRILFGSTVQVGQNHVVLRFVRNRLGHLLASASARSNCPVRISNWRFIAPNKGILPKRISAESSISIAE